MERGGNCGGHSGRVIFRSGRPYLSTTASRANSVKADSVLTEFALGLFFLAMTTIPAGLAAIIASAMPLIVAAFAPLVVKERVAGLKLLGLTLGFGGAIWIMSSRVVGGIATPLVWRWPCSVPRHWR